MQQKGPLDGSGWSGERRGGSSLLGHRPGSDQPRSGRLVDGVCCKTPNTQWSQETTLMMCPTLSIRNVFSTLAKVPITISKYIKTCIANYLCIKYWTNVTVGWDFVVNLAQPFISVCSGPALNKDKKREKCSLRSLWPAYSYTVYNSQPKFILFNSVAVKAATVTSQKKKSQKITKTSYVRLVEIAPAFSDSAWIL